MFNDNSINRDRPANYSTVRRIIGLAGPCGAGKSTLARHIESVYEVDVVHEPILEDILAKYESSSIGTGAQLQEAIISRRAASISQAKRSVILLDRSITEDREVFFPLHHMLGALSAKDVQQLNCLSRLAETDVGSPSAFICLSAKEETLRCRAQVDSRPQWLIDSLSLQISLYQKWMSLIMVPFVKIDTTERSITELYEIAAWILTTIDSALTGTALRSDALDVQWHLPDVATRAG